MFAGQATYFPMKVNTSGVIPPIFAGALLSFPATLGNWIPFLRGWNAELGANGWLRNGIYVGRPAKPGAKGHGDYLIRNLLGADRDHGVLAVGDVVAMRERIRLHVRDAVTAVEDLELLLAPQEFDGKAEAALLFSCNGRGSQMFGVNDRDLSTLQAALGGSVPVAGMFCAGEIGPVGERNWLHGHTASIAILRAKAEHA